MPNHICHFEFMPMDVEKAKEFYGKVFDWQFEEMPGPMPYTMIRTGQAPEGGMTAKPPEAPHPSLNVYFIVDDIEDTLAKATGAGGQVVVPKTEIPDMGAWAFFCDPDGIVVGVYEAKK